MTEATRRYRAVRQPENEAEELILYKNLFELQVMGRRREEAEKAIAKVDEESRTLIEKVKPFSSWEDIATALNASVSVVRQRFRPDREE